MNSDRAALSVASGHRNVALGTHRSGDPLATTSHYGVVPQDQEAHLLKEYEAFSTAEVTLPLTDPGSPP